MNLIARMFLELFMIYGIYNEIGPWTALFSLLLFIYCELSSYALVKIIMMINILKIVG